MKEYAVKLKQWFDFKKRNIKVWPGAYVYPTAIIGDNVSIGRNTEIGHKVKIGNNVRIGAQCFLCEGVVIEDNVFVSPNVKFSNDKYPPANRTSWQPCKTIVAWGASIGTGVCILPGVRIGINALIGMGSVVTKNVGDYETWYGVPATKRIILNEHEKMILREVG